MWDSHLELTTDSKHHIDLLRGSTRAEHSASLCTDQASRQFATKEIEKRLKRRSRRIRYYQVDVTNRTCTKERGLVDILRRLSEAEHRHIAIRLPVVLSGRMFPLARLVDRSLYIRRQLILMADQNRRPRP